VPPLRWEGGDLKTLKAQARSQAERLIAIEAARLGVRANGLRLADQKTLWGSCGPQGRISLSWRLVLAPPEVLRYVVIHELAHLVHRNHSQRFWTLVERQMPDFQIARRWLRSHGAGLHALVFPGRTGV
jgi:predicted metal-dependent hydrolase